MTPPTIILDSRPVVGQCVPFAPKGNGDDGASSPDAIIGKLRGTNPAEIEKTLDYIIQNGSCNTRFIQPLLNLLSSNDPVIFGKALTALMLMKENGIKFTADQEQAFTKRLNSAQIQFADGGLKITGNGVRLPNGAVLDKGTIFSKDGQWFVAEGDSAVISGVKIINEDRGIKWRVDLFFDGKDHQESETCVSINVSQGKLTIGSKAEYRGAMISLAKNNPFIPVDENDDIKFEAERGMTLTIEDRKGTGLIPKITMKTSNGEGFATIMNGCIQTNINANGRCGIGIGRGGYHSLTRQSTTAPFEVVLTDNAGQYKMLEVHNKQDVLSTRYGNFEKIAGQGYRLVFNNYTQVGLLDLEEGTRGSFIDGFVPFKIDTSLSGNMREYTIEDFQALYPNANLTGYIDSTNIKLAIDYLQSLPSKVRASIKGVDFPEKWESVAVAYATHDGVIHLKRNSFDMPTFQHECAHVLTFYYQNQVVENIKTVLRQNDLYALMTTEDDYLLLQMDESIVLIVNETDNTSAKIKLKPIADLFGVEIESNGERIDQQTGETTSIFGRITIPLNLLTQAPNLFADIRETSEPLADVLLKYSQAAGMIIGIRANSFEGHWKNIAGDVYGKYVNPDTENNINQGWTDNTIDDGPRYGCVRSYGSKNFYEDVATFVEQIWKNPDFFRPLVDSKSASYDSRYKQKLGLLLEYGFITQKQYDRAIGTPAKKIDTVK